MTTRTSTDAPAVPIVTVLDPPGGLGLGNPRIRVTRPAAGHTFTFPVVGDDPEIVASCLRGALADAFLAGKTEAST